MSEKRRYDREFLERFCKDNDITYENIDESIKVTRDIHIKGDCKGENCYEKFDKKFRNLIETSGPYCDNCSLKNNQEKRKITCKEKYGVEYSLQSTDVRNKRKKTNLERYGVEYSIQSEQCKEKIKKTNLERYGVECPLQNENIKSLIKKTNLEKYGVEYPLQSEEAKKKSKQTCLKNKGVEYPMQSSEVRDKCKQSYLEKYGVYHPLQSDIVKEHIKKTCLKRYGVECPFQNEDIKKTIKHTNLEKYGVEYPLQSEEVREKSKKTCLERYGVEISSQNIDVRNKAKQTCLERYGVEHATQNTEILERASKSSYKLKDYTFPSGKVIKCQGYEPFALDILINDKITEEDIVTSKKEVPEIWYKDSDDKDHRYYVDIFIKSINKFIEVKSTWTYKKNMEKVELTKNTVKEKGFLYECWVFDGKGNVIETIY